MTSDKLSLVHSSRQSAASPSQKSLKKSFAPLGGRGRDLGYDRGARGRVHGRLTMCQMDAAFAINWRAYLLYRHGTPQAIGAHFGVTYQCALNWLACVSRPVGPKVAYAAYTDPEGFAQFMGRAL
ncbi:hypothetical protein [Roseicitreum antarcticum]|uniref:Uncharacterized protein n=1 Tax=Roseicitreum antarcticum TaxID=564137 RepID=A0A1H2WC28_9RHOB|nr:hypothetical protein [Roseicitreum antarcticum]SDW77599.1 hypothetical protein SAMN04488238_103320 [Roseicitreum antarcticum]